MGCSDQDSEESAVCNILRSFFMAEMHGLSRHESLDGSYRVLGDYIQQCCCCSDDLGGAYYVGTRCIRSAERSSLEGTRGSGGAKCADAYCFHMSGAWRRYVV